MSHDRTHLPCCQKKPLVALSNTPKSTTLQCQHCAADSPFHHQNVPLDVQTWDKWCFEFCQNGLLTSRTCGVLRRVAASATQRTPHLRHTNTNTKTTSVNHHAFLEEIDSITTTRCLVHHGKTSLCIHCKTQQVRWICQTKKRG